MPLLELPTFLRKLESYSGEQQTKLALKLVTLTFLRTTELRAGCQSAFKFDPGSASNFDPFERRVLTVALASSELAGVAETWRARAA